MEIACKEKKNHIMTNNHSSVLFKQSSVCTRLAVLLGRRRLLSLEQVCLLIPQTHGTPCAGHHPGPFINISSLSPTVETNNIICILQMRRLRFREIYPFVRGTARFEAWKFASGVQGYKHYTTVPSLLPYVLRCAKQRKTTARAKG